MTHLNRQFSLRSSHLEKFHIATQKLALALSQAGSPVSSDPSKVYLQYRESDSLRQNLFLEKCEFYHSLIEAALESQIDIVNDKRYIWKSLTHMNCRPSSDLMDLIHSGDAVEIYYADGVQKFSNFDFCLNTTYCIEELFWHPWHLLFGRDPKHLEQIMTEFRKAVNEAEGPFEPLVDVHDCWEVLSGSKMRCRVKMRMFAPIRNRSGQTEYMIAASEITRLS